jgi:polyribonucleotide nucleotidyltransferase
MSDEYVKDVNEVVSEGDKVKVKLIGIDKEGKLKLSMKQA